MARLVFLKYSSCKRVENDLEWLAGPSESHLEVVCVEKR
jgi:hypothetical protein